MRILRKIKIISTINNYISSFGILFNRKEFIDSIKEVLLQKDSIFKNSHMEKIISRNSFMFRNTERIFSLYMLELWRINNKLEL